jgi:hypothetical protein
MITADYYRLMAEYNAWMNGIAGRRGPRLECWIRRRIGDIGEVLVVAGNNLSRSAPTADVGRTDVQAEGLLSGLAANG